MAVGRYEMYKINSNIILVGIAALLGSVGSLVVGYAWADNIAGDSGDDVLPGTNGQDNIWGLDGDDVIWGKSGNDKLYGMAL